jgi:hypothetical protein
LANKNAEQADGASQAHRFPIDPSAGRNKATSYLKKVAGRFISAKARINRNQLPLLNVLDEIAIHRLKPVSATQNMLKPGYRPPGIKVCNAF